MDIDNCPKKEGKCHNWNFTGRCPRGNKCLHEHKCAICGSGSHHAKACKEFQKHILKE